MDAATAAPAVPTCLRCTKPYSLLPGRNTTLLQCGHNICESCLMEATGVMSADGAGDAQEKCPMCVDATDVIVHPGGGIISRYAEEVGVAAHDSVCAECKPIGGKEAAVEICETCSRVAVCHQHSVPHKSLGHNVRDMYPFCGCAITCAEHEGTPMFFYCKTHGIPVCANCVLDSHKREDGHDIVKISEAKVLLNAELRTYHENLDSGRRRLLEGVELLDAAKEDLDNNRAKAVEDVETAIAAVIAALNARKDVLLKEIADTYAEKSSMYAHHKFCHNTTAQTLQLMVEMTGAALSTAQPSEPHAQCPHWQNVITMTQVRDADKVSTKLAPEDTPEIPIPTELSFDARTLTALLANIRTAGEVVVMPPDEE